MSKVEWRESDQRLSPVLVDEQGGEREISWTPQPGSQSLFLSCPVTEVLYAGNRGGGKTDTLIMDFAQHTGKDDRTEDQIAAGVPQWRGWGAEWRGIMFRQTYPQLLDVINKTKKWYPQLFPDISFNEQKSIWTWKTGETLRLSYGLNEDDYWNYHGSSYPWIGFEELTTWASPGFYKKMFSCLRSSEPGMPRKVRATTNPYGCVPYGEVLTATRGWVPIQDIQPGEDVVSVNSQMEATTATVQSVIDKQWSGQMVKREGRGLMMEFTEDHRLPLLSTDKQRFSLREFTDLPGQADILRTPKTWSGGHRTPSRVMPSSEWTGRKLKSNVVDDLDPLDYAALAGWVASEGFTLIRDQAFCITQTKPHTVPVIGALLQRCGFSYRYNGKDFCVTEPRWAADFKRLGKCRDKFIPRWVLESGPDILQACFDALMLGDGCENTYYTTSKQLADDVAEIATKLGRSVYVSSRQRPERDGLSYSVNMSDRPSLQLHTGNHRYNVSTRCRSVNVTKTPFSGKVYCLSVPETETFFVRQNGCVWLSGNSGHSWVKLRFELPIAPGRLVGDIVKDVRPEIRPNDREPDRVAIRSYLNENKILLTADPGYKGRLRAAARNPAELAAWMDGSWDIVAGGMFDDVWKADEHVILDIVNFIPSSWRIDRSFDWGSSKPFSVGWWAESDGTDLVLPNGKRYATVRGDLYRVAEWYGWNGQPNEGVRALATEVTKGIIERELRLGLHGRVRSGPADSAIFSVENGVSIARDMAASVLIDGQRYRGVSWLRADKRPGSRKAGWELCRKYLKFAVRTGRPRENPGLFVCESCKQFIRTIPSLPRDMQGDPDDVDTDAEDHIADEVRYRVRYSGQRIVTGTTVGMGS